MADVIYAKLEQLHQMACSIGTVLKALQAQVKTIDERGGEDNVLEKILVNGAQLFPDREKAVRMTIPTKISDLDNDKKFQENVIEQVLLNGVKMPVDSQKRVSITIPTGTNNLVNDAGYQTNADVLAAIRANAYVHPSHTAYGSGLYKIVVDNLGHVTSAAKAVKSDITALGIPGQDTVYTHPKYTARGTGLYKIAVDALGHVSGVAGVSKGDITALGIPGQDTVYTHPGYIGHGLGLYKLAVDGQGHVSSVAGITKSDITALGIPGQDTNSWRGIQNNLSSDSTSDSLSAAMGKALNTSLNNAITRIATCEQKIKAIGQTTEVYLRSLPYKAGKELCGSTVTLATVAADVSFVKFGSGSDEPKLLRGSSAYKYANIHDLNNDAWVDNRILVTFQNDGRITATDDEKLYLMNAYDKNSLSYVGNMYCYNYVST